MKLTDKETWQKRIARISNVRAKRELRLTPGYQTHEVLWVATKLLPTDFCAVW